MLVSFTLNLDLSSDNIMLFGLAPQKRVRLADPLKVFRKEVAERHNLKRKDHCVGDLTLDDGLNKVSQDLADQLAAADVTPPNYDATKMQSVYFGKGDIALNGMYTNMPLLSNKEQFSSIFRWYHC